jgi:hypothetical protein
MIPSRSLNNVKKLSIAKKGKSQKAENRKGRDADFEELASSLEPPSERVKRRDEETQRNKISSGLPLPLNHRDKVGGKRNQMKMIDIVLIQNLRRRKSARTPGARKLVQKLGCSSCLCLLLTWYMFCIDEIEHMRQNHEPNMKKCLRNNSEDNREAGVNPARLRRCNE